MRLIDMSYSDNRKTLSDIGSEEYDKHNMRWYSRKSILQQFNFSKVYYNSHYTKSIIFIITEGRGVANILSNNNINNKVKCNCRRSNTISNKVKIRSSYNIINSFKGAKHFQFQEFRLLRNGEFKIDM